MDGKSLGFRNYFSQDYKVRLITSNVHAEILTFVDKLVTICIQYLDLLNILDASQSERLRSR